MFRTRFTKLEPAFEKVGGPVIVEKELYKDPHTRIQEMMKFGERLEQARASAYEFSNKDKVPDNYYGDPTKQPNFDMVDADALQREFDDKIKKLKEDKKNALAQAKKVDKDKKVQEVKKDEEGDKGSSKVLDNDGDSSVTKKED